MLRKELNESNKQDDIQTQKDYYVTKKYEEFMDGYYGQLKKQMGISLVEEKVEYFKPRDEETLQILKTLSPTNTTRDTMLSTRKASSIQNKHKSQNLASLATDESTSLNKSKAVQNFLAQRLQKSPD